MSSPQLLTIEEHHRLPRLDRTASGANDICPFSIFIPRTSLAAVVGGRRYLRGDDPNRPFNRRSSSEDHLVLVAWDSGADRRKRFEARRRI
jgi:hypothetical protein